MRAIDGESGHEEYAPISRESATACQSLATAFNTDYMLTWTTRKHVQARELS